MNAKLNPLATMLLILILVTHCFAWHRPHVQITRAAVRSLPVAMQQRLGSEERNLIEVYCWYPDRYVNADSLERAVLRPYCENLDSKEIHNVTWRRKEDLESLEYLLEAIADNLHNGKTVIAAQYAGVLAHLLEDSTSPAHCPVPFDEKFVYIRDLLPPPPGKEKIELHPALEITAPEFDLGTRSAQMVGRSIHEAAATLLDRCYAIIRDNRARLLEMVRAVYTDDDDTLNRLRLKA